MLLVSIGCLNQIVVSKLEEGRSYTFGSASELSRRIKSAGANNMLVFISLPAMFYFNISVDFVIRCLIIICLFFMLILHFVSFAKIRQ